jgi:hypothetical protein
VLSGIRFCPGLLRGVHSGRYLEATPIGIVFVWLTASVFGCFWLFLPECWGRLEMQDDFIVIFNWFALISSRVLRVCLLASFWTPPRIKGAKLHRLCA